MKLSLVVVTAGKWEGKVIPITLSQFLIGRDPQCQLRPASAVISKRHCAILVRGEQVFIHDFGSTNGTFLNDQPVKGEQELHDGDRLKVGPLDFTVRMEATAVADKPATPASPPGPAPAQPEPEKPQPVATKGAGEAADDEAAAMLLLLSDETSPGSSGEGGVPEGSTVFDIPSPFGQPPGAEKPGEKPGEKQSKEAAAKAANANTSTAAKAILEKYMKRPRG